MVGPHDNALKSESTVAIAVVLLTVPESGIMVIASGHRSLGGGTATFNVKSPVPRDVKDRVSSTTALDCRASGMLLTCEVKVAMYQNMVGNSIFSVPTDSASIFAAIRFARLVVSCYTSQGVTSSFEDS